MGHSITHRSNPHFVGPHKINNRMCKKLRMDTSIQTELPTSHYYIMKAHIAE